MEKKTQDFLLRCFFWNHLVDFVIYNDLAIEYQGENIVCIGEKDIITPLAIVVSIVDDGAAIEVVSNVVARFPMAEAGSAIDYIAHLFVQNAMNREFLTDTNLN